MIGILNELQRRACAECRAKRLELIQHRQWVAGPLQEQHGDVDVEQMFATLLRGAPGWMQRKSEECQSADAGKGSCGLRLRRHPAAERLAAGDERQFRQQAERGGRSEEATSEI